MLKEVIRRYKDGGIRVKGMSNDKNLWVGNVEYYYRYKNFEEGNIEYIKKLYHMYKHHTEGEKIIYEY